MLNRVVLVGRVATDPEIRYTPAGQPMCRFRLAVPRPRRNGNGEGKQEADFLTVVTWGKEAEICSRWMQKGRLIAVEGSLRSGSYEANGRTIRTVEVVGRVRFLDKPKAAETQAPAEEEPPLEEAFEDVPF